MTASVEAVYENGVFRPLGPVNLRDNQSVRLSIHATNQDEVRDWLERVRILQKRIIEQRGVLPDSTPDIAADRVRDCC